MLVPSKTANGGPPLNSGSVDESTCPPGAEMSGLSRCSNAVGPPEEKLVTTPLRPVSSRAMMFETVTGARPPVVPRYARSRAPSRSAIIPDGSGSASGIAFASPGRLSTSTSPAAPARAARIAFDSNVQWPRDTSTINPPRLPGRSGDFAALLTSSSGPHR